VSLPFETVWAIVNCAPGSGTVLPFAAQYSFATPEDPEQRAQLEHWVEHTLVPGLRALRDESGDFSPLFCRMPVWNTLHYCAWTRHNLSVFSNSSVRRMMCESDIFEVCCADVGAACPNLLQVSASWGCVEDCAYAEPYWLNGFIFQVATYSQGGLDQQLYTEICVKAIGSGFVDFVLAGLRSFVLVESQEDLSTLNPVLTGFCGALQMLALGSGCPNKILQCVESRGVSAEQFQGLLLDCVHRGSACPKHIGMNSLDVRAAMVIGVVWGREEDEEGANTVPAEISAQIVGLLNDSLVTSLSAD
jgi:hypothetical protein